MGLELMVVLKRVVENGCGGVELASRPVALLEQSVLADPVDVIFWPKATLLRYHYCVRLASVEWLGDLAHS